MLSAVPILLLLEVDMLNPGCDGAEYTSLENAAAGASRRGRGGERADAAEPRGACPGNTPLSSSQYDPLAEPFDPVVAIDWLETAGVIHWGLLSDYPLRETVESHYQYAVETDEPAAIVLNERHCLVHPRGMGRGQQSRLTYRITCGAITLGLSFRENASRQLSNFLLTVPGKACLLDGAMFVREWAHQIIEDLGGRLADEWIRRVDVCVDLPGVNPRAELLPACQAQQYLATARRGNVHFDQRGLTGFTIGSCNRVQLQIYDKLLETISKNDPEYHLAMCQKRWGTLVCQATRVEIRVGRDWLSQFMKYDAETILQNLGSLMHQLLGEESRCFFKLLAEAPDRKNNHQTRTQTLPLWNTISDLFLSRAGKQELKFQRINRGLITMDRLYKTVRSMLAKAAAMRGERFTSLDEAQQLFANLHEINCGTDAELANIWNRKRVELGMTAESLEFDFGGNASAAGLDLDW